MNLDDLIIESGTYFEILDRINPETVLEGPEILTRMIQDYMFRGKTFWSGNAAVYAVEDGKAVVYVTDRSTNPFLRHGSDAIRTLNEDGFYRLNEEELRDIKSTATRFELHQFGLKRMREGRKLSDIGILQVDAKNASKLTEYQAGFITANYGVTNFDHVMRTLKINHDSKINIDLFTPEFVKAACKQGALARLITLGDYPNVNINATAQAMATSGIYMAGFPIDSENILSAPLAPKPYGGPDSLGRIYFNALDPKESAVLHGALRGNYAGLSLQERERLFAENIISIYTGDGNGSNYKACGFMISTNGFFCANYHLFESLLKQNNGENNHNPFGDTVPSVNLGGTNYNLNTRFLVADPMADTVIGKIDIETDEAQPIPFPMHLDDLPPGEPLEVFLRDTVRRDEGNIYYARFSGFIPETDPDFTYRIGNPVFGSVPLQFSAGTNAGDSGGIITTEHFELVGMNYGKKRDFRDGSRGFPCRLAVKSFDLTMVLNQALKNFSQSR